VTFTWNWGDGAAAETDADTVTSKTHTYAANGTYEIAVAHSDGDEATTEVVVAPKVWPLVWPNPGLSDSQIQAVNDTSDFGGMSCVYAFDVEPPASFANHDAFSAFYSEHGIGFNFATLPDAVAMEFDSGLPGTSTVRVEPISNCSWTSMRNGLPDIATDETTTFPLGTYQVTVRILDANDDVIGQGHGSYEVVGPLIASIYPRILAIGVGPSNVDVSAFVGGQATEVFLDGVSQPITATTFWDGLTAFSFSVNPDGELAGTGAITLSVGGVMTPVEVLTFEAMAGDEAEFDPEDYTIGEVIAYVEANPTMAKALYDAESAGKGRITLLADLESRLA